MNRSGTITALCAALALGGCGSTSSSSSAPAASTPKPRSKPRPPHATAYDLSIREQVQTQIMGQMHHIAVKNHDVDVDKRSHCVADTSRTFTCSSDITLMIPNSGGTCADISSTQRGTVNPDGSFDWATTTSDSNETVCP